MENSIAELIEFSGNVLTNDQARQLLQAHNGDVNNALVQFYDELSVGVFPGSVNPANDPDRYDDSLFAAGRDGYTDGSASRPFEIDAGVVGDYSGAPTRPPSRISNHSGDSGINMSNVPLKSVEENGQESGVIGSSGTVFGPANRDMVYDTNKWAVALVGTQERVPDVAADQRKREEAGPAFLKPLPDGDYLPGLITMLSTVSSIRNLLLCPQHVATDYGREEGWWRGTPITPAARINFDGEPSQADYYDLVHETQRLIAFLDRTDRAYGSVEPLCKLEAFTNAIPEQPEATNLEKFLLGWERAIEWTGLGNGLKNPLHSVVEADNTVHKSHLLDAVVIRNAADDKISLYDVLDTHMFRYPYAGSALVKTLCNILVIRLSPSNSTATKLDVDIPATFYADRYMEENAPIMSQMLRDAAQHEQKITEINGKINKIKYHHSKTTGKSVESLKLLKSSMKAFETWDGPEVQEGLNPTLKKLQKVYDSIELKLKELDEQKKKVREILDETTRIFKPPVEEPNPAATDDKAINSMEIIDSVKSLVDGPTRRYTLCGVTTEPSIIYVRTATFDPTDKRWWRIQYQYNYENPIILREKVTEDVVLKRASEEHSQALLVYANKEATHAPLVPLPKPLEDFVKQDNFQFMEELQQASEKPAWDTSATPPHNTVNWDGPFHSDDVDGDFANMSARAWLDHQQRSNNTLTPSSEMAETNGDAREIEMKEAEQIEVLPPNGE